VRHPLVILAGARPAMVRGATGLMTGGEPRVPNVSRIYDWLLGGMDN
jgi:hypothetical protein